MAHVCHGRGLQSEGNFRELFLSYLPVGSGDGTQAHTKPPLSAVPELLPAAQKFHFSFQSSAGIFTLSHCFHGSGSQANSICVFRSASRVYGNTEIFTNINIPRTLTPFRSFKISFNFYPFLFTGSASFVVITNAMNTFLQQWKCNLSLFTALTCSH